MWSACGASARRLWCLWSACGVPVGVLVWCLWGACVVLVGCLWGAGGVPARRLRGDCGMHLVQVSTFVRDLGCTLKHIANHTCTHIHTIISMPHFFCFVSMIRQAVRDWVVIPINSVERFDEKNTLGHSLLLFHSVVSSLLQTLHGSRDARSIERPQRKTGHGCRDGRSCAELG